MNSVEATNQPNLPKGVGWKLFGFLSRINTQIVSMVILILLSLQVLIGIFMRSPTQTDLVALFFGKTVIVRLLGYIGLINGLIDFYCNVFVHHELAWKWTFLKRPWNGLLAILLLWSLLAIGVAQDRVLAFFGGAFRYEGYLSYLAYAGIFISASQIRYEKYRRILFIVTAVASSVLAGLTLLRELAGWSWLMYRNGQVGSYSATFINSNHYGYYLCVSMMIIAGLFMMVEKLAGKIACGCCFTLNLVVLLFNGSLGPYLAIALGLVVLFAFIGFERDLKKLGRY